MKNMSRILGAGLILAIVVAGIILFAGVIGDKKPKSGSDDPNKGFRVEGKESYLWTFSTGEDLKYIFKGRDKAPGTPENLYDPESWQLTLYGETKNRAALEFYENRVLLLQGRMESDGMARVNNYIDRGAEPTEYWQIFLNMILLLPRRELSPKETKTEDVEFPGMENHRVRGKAVFVDKGEAALEKGGPLLRKIMVAVELKVELRAKGDRITDYLGEGHVYWDPRESKAVAGEWEYTSGLPEERYFWPWRYARFAREGFAFPPPDSDLATQSSNVLWTVREDISVPDRTMRSFQKNARDQLDYMGEVQETFRELGLVDQDGDGKGEYGLLTEISGAQGKRLRAAGGFKPWPDPRPKLQFAEEFGSVNEGGFSERDSYHFQVFLRGKTGLVTDGDAQPAGDAANADLQEEEGGWCGYSWPTVWGTTGKAVFFCNGNGKTWESLDFVLDGKASPPKPSDTGLPKEGTWKRISRFESLPPIPRKRVVVKGKPFPPAVDQAVNEIEFFRLQMDEKALSKGLREADYLRLEKIRRDFDRARADFELTEEEAARTRDAYAEIYRDMSLDAAEGLIAQVAAALEKAPDEEAAKAVESLRARRKAIGATIPASETVNDFLEDVRVLLERTIAHKKPR